MLETRSRLRHVKNIQLNQFVQTKRWPVTLNSLNTIWIWSNRADEVPQLEQIEVLE